MANLYRTKEIKKLLEQKIERDSSLLVTDKTINGDLALRLINEMRIFKKFMDEFIEELRKLDRKDDEYLAKIKAEIEARKAAGNDQ